MKKNTTKFLMFFLIFSSLPVFAFAATPAKFYYGGWIPYWNKTPGIQDITNHLESKLNEISPFSYEVKYDGTIVDKLKISQGFWPNWLSAIHDLKIKITPTIAWFDGDGIHNLLSNKKKRIAQEDAIAALANLPNFDGVDIDYEGKKAETKNYFSLFIQGLATRLHTKKKTLSCTIEPRTPLASLYRIMPTSTVERANDYNVLNTYCDEVRIMAYDQGFIDYKLNDKKAINGNFYAPVADPEWVKKVIGEATPYIKKNKIMLGIPTYGYEYEVAATTTASSTLQYIYKRIKSVTFEDAANLATSLEINPQRNSAGELSFTYYASTTNSTNLVWFSDAEAIADKIKIAKDLKLRGIILFKLDGEADPAVWDKMK